MYSLINSVSLWAIPAIVAFIPLFALVKKVSVFEAFGEGAKGGFDTAVNIIPNLVGMMVAISVFRASGALDLLIGLVGPMFSRIGVPEQVLPLSILRTITGAGSLAYTTDLIKQYGPDSMIGRIASTVQGSTDTTLYVLTVYFGAVGIRKTRYALKVGLIADLAGFIASLAICLWIFG